MGENRIYGALEFKSFDITRAEVLFDWVEQSRNLMCIHSAGKSWNGWCLCYGRRQKILVLAIEG